MANDRVLKKAKENKEILSSMQEKQSMSDVFSQALIGFLPLIAGIGSSEDTADLAQVGLKSMEGLGAANAANRASSNAMNAAALSSAQEEVQAEGVVASAAAKETALNSRQDRDLASKREIGLMAQAGQDDRLNRQLKSTESLANNKAEAALASASTAGQVSTDRTFGKRYIEWTGGDKLQTERSIVSLKKAVQNLRDNGSNLTGMFTGDLPDGMTREDVLDQRQLVNSALVAGVKSVFPGSLTEKETEIFLKSHYNPQGSIAGNIDSLTRYIEKLEAGYRNINKQVDDFESRRTLKKDSNVDAKKARLEELRFKKGN